MSVKARLRKALHRATQDQVALSEALDEQHLAGWSAGYAAGREQMDTRLRESIAQLEAKAPKPSMPLTVVYRPRWRADDGRGVLTLGGIDFSNVADHVEVVLTHDEFAEVTVRFPMCKLVTP